MEFIKYFLEFTFQSGWTFFGMILFIAALKGLIKAILSFIPNRIHFGGTQTINEVEKQYVNKKKDE